VETLEEILTGHFTILLLEMVQEKALPQNRELIISLLLEV